LTKTEQKKGEKSPLLIVIFGFFLMLFAGLIYSWSIFIGPIENELGFLRKDTALVFTISLSISILGQITAGALKRKSSTVVVFGLPAVLFISGFFFASRITSVLGLYLSYGAMVGFAIGMIYNAVMAYSLDHFPKRIGFVSGVLLMGFGMGGLILGTLATLMIDHIGWRPVFIILGVGFSLLSAAAIFVYKTNNGLKPHEMHKAGTGETPKQMVSSWPYILLFFWLLSTASASLTVIGHSAPIAADLGANPYLAALAAGLISVLNGLSRPLFGRLYEIIGQRKLRLILTLASVLAGLFSLVGYSLGSLALVLVGYMCAGLENGGNAVYASTYIKERYGQKNYGMNLGITNIHMIIASFLGNGLAGQIKTGTSSYRGGLLMMLGYGLFALLLFFIFRRIEIGDKGRD
jgi:OFA family oxalate/formate antiporter-like MFS transporter